jgi:hypothetical protein
MITYDYILIVIGTIVLFFQGFYFGRWKMLGVVIASLILIFLSLVIMMVNGIYIYSGAILDTNIYKLVVATIYCAFWLGLGYVLGRNVVMKESYIRVSIVNVER